jgi:hypothetical protein
MEDFVSGQVDADRSFAAATAAGSDRIGFAWSPRNSLGLTRNEFVTQTAAILGRIAAAIQDSAAPDPDPGAAACAPDWCTTTLDGAAFAEQWQAFSSWSPTQPVFLTPPITATAGSPAGPLTVQLQTLGLPDSTPAPITLTIASSSATGEFATTATGPWTPTLSLPLAAGSTTVSYFYLDTTPGTPTVTATLADSTAATQTETITAPGRITTPLPEPPTQPPPFSPNSRSTSADERG